MEQQISIILQELKEMKQEINDLILYSKPHFTFSEFCRFASISEHRGRQLKRDGVIPFTRPFGRKLYITREEAIEVLKQNPVLTKATIEQKANNHLKIFKAAA